MPSEHLMYRIIGGDRQEYGPATEEEIRLWISEGRLSPKSLARQEPGGDWRELGTFHEFSDALRMQAGISRETAAPPPRLEPPTEIFGAETAPLQISSCLRRGWRLLADNFSLIFAATFLVWTVELISQLLPLLSVVYWTLEGVFYGGLYLLILQRIRGQPAAVSNVFYGFSRNFAQLALVGMVTSVLTRIGFFFCLLPGIYLTVAWAFSVPLAAEKEMTFWPAMETSRRVVGRQWFSVLSLLALAFLPTVLMHVLTEIQIVMAMMGAMKDIFGTIQPGWSEAMEKMPELMRITGEKTFGWVLAAKGVLLLNLPFALSALMHAYEDLFGPKTRTSA